jgi:hypothetical protein
VPGQGDPPIGEGEGDVVEQKARQAVALLA